MTPVDCRAMPIYLDYNATTPIEPAVRAASGNPDE